MSEQRETHHITRLLSQVAEGQEDARDELVSAVYQQLRKIAQRRMASDGPNPSLQATELVHEAYLKLAPGMGEPPGTCPTHWRIPVYRHRQAVVARHCECRCCAWYPGNLSCSVWP